MHPKLSVVIPFFNEQECLESVCMEARQVLDALLPGDWELVMVDDGSSDETPAIVDRLARKTRDFRPCTCTPTAASRPRSRLASRPPAAN